MPSNPTNRLAPTSDYATGTNADAVLTYASPGAGILSHILAGVIWSYSGGTPAGRLTIKDGSSIILDVDITASGPGYLPLDASPIRITPGNAMEVRLWAGGAGVVGKVTARHWTDTN